MTSIQSIGFQGIYSYQIVKSGKNIPKNVIDHSLQAITNRLPQGTDILYMSEVPGKNKRWRQIKVADTFDPQVESELRQQDNTHGRRYERVGDFKPKPIASVIHAAVPQPSPAARRREALKGTTNKNSIQRI